MFDLYAESFGGLVAGIIRASGSAAHRISDWATGASDETQADRAVSLLLFGLQWNLCSFADAATVAHTFSYTVY